MGVVDGAVRCLMHRDYRHYPIADTIICCASWSFRHVRIFNPHRRVVGLFSVTVCFARASAAAHSFHFETELPARLKSKNQHISFASEVSRLTARRCEMVQRYYSSIITTIYIKYSRRLCLWILQNVWK
jgi:hypothetical protein